MDGIYVPRGATADVQQADASTLCYDRYLVATDPPYYDNINYANLADFFYVWLRRSLGDVYPELLGTLLTRRLTNSWRTRCGTRMRTSS